MNPWTLFQILFAMGRLHSSQIWQTEPESLVQNLFLFCLSNYIYLLLVYVNAPCKCICVLLSCISLTLTLFQDVPGLPFVTTFWERNLPSVGGFMKFMGVSSFLTIATVVGAVAYKKGLLPRS